MSKIIRNKVMLYQCSCRNNSERYSEVDRRGGKMGGGGGGGGGVHVSTLYIYNNDIATRFAVNMYMYIFYKWLSEHQGN